MELKEFKKRFKEGNIYILDKSIFPNYKKVDDYTIGTNHGSDTLCCVVNEVIPMGMSESNKTVYYFYILDDKIYSGHSYGVYLVSKEELLEMLTDYKKLVIEKIAELKGDI